MGIKYLHKHGVELQSGDLWCAIKDAIKGWDRVPHQLGRDGLDEWDFVVWIFGSVGMECYKLQGLRVESHWIKYDVGV